MGGDLLELTVSSQDMPREELMEILSRYDRKRKFYRLKNGDFVNMEENGLESLQEVRQALQLTDKQLMQDKIEVPAYRMLYLDETLQENAMMEVIRDVSFASRIEKLQNPDFEKEYVPDSLKEFYGNIRKPVPRGLECFTATGSAEFWRTIWGLEKRCRSSASY